MAYIDSELAKRRQLQASNGADSSQQASSIIGATFGADLTVHRQPATLGKLQEIDLGPDATARNIAATQAAKRRLAGELPEPVEAPQRVRLRPDGKPWRQRRRRNSEDVKRDQLVEEVMRESKSIAIFTVRKAELILQLSSTPNLMPPTRMTLTIKLPMIDWRRSFDGISWMRCLSGGKGLPQQRRQKGQKRRLAKVRDWAEVGAQGLP